MWKEKCQLQSPQDQVLSMKDIHLLQKDKGQRIRDKDGDKGIRGEGKGREGRRGQRVLVPEKDRRLPQIEEREGDHRQMEVCKGGSGKSALGVKFQLSTLIG